MKDLNRKDKKRQTNENNYYILGTFFSNGNTYHIFLIEHFTTIKKCICILKSIYMYIYKTREARQSKSWENLALQPLDVVLIFKHNSFPNPC